ncbi:ATP-binding protein, partial [Gammaproteobacteria bacterium]|nr:ATP-binding protein [Gammaproteobacteria bacterium]
VVDSLTAASVQGPVAIGPVSIDGLLRTSVDIADGFRPEGLDLIVECASDHSANSNDILLSRCLLNLIRNAFEASGATGSITLAVYATAATLDRPYASSVSLGVEREHYDCVIEVSDQGCGMTESALQSAFKPLFSTKDATRPRGLGMQSLKALANHGLAYIEFHSEPTRGSCVRLHLCSPVSDATVGEAPNTQREPLRDVVVIADDDALVGDMLLRSVRQLGYQAEWYQNPREALAAIVEHGASLLITDFNMTEMSGEELAQDLKAISPSIPILIYSGQAAAIPTRPIYADVLQKPIGLESLDAAIKKAMTP